jgi:hypothetical protein
VGSHASVKSTGCGGVQSFGNVDELESTLALGRGRASSSSSSITIGELRDPMPPKAMAGECREGLSEVCLRAGAERNPNSLSGVLIT